MAVAVERYFAVAKPVQYHVAVNAASTWYVEQLTVRQGRKFDIVPFFLQEKGVDLHGPSHRPWGGHQLAPFFRT